MAHDVVYRCRSCGVSVTIGGLSDGNQKVAAPKAKRLLHTLCVCLDTNYETREMPTQWSYAPHNH